MFANSVIERAPPFSSKAPPLFHFESDASSLARLSPLLQFIRLFFALVGATEGRWLLTLTMCFFPNAETVDCSVFSSGVSVVVSFGLPGCLLETGKRFMLSSSPATANVLCRLKFAAMVVQCTVPSCRKEARWHRIRDKISGMHTWRHPGLYSLVYLIDLSLLLSSLL
jgi:hypothetical protein